MWDSLVKYYFTAYEHALEQSSERRDEPREFVRFVEAPGLHVRKPHQVPVWKDIYVQSDVPEKLASLKNWQIICGGRGTLKQNHYLKEWIHLSGRR